MTPRPPREPQLELIEAAWQLRAPSGRIVTCGIYRDAAPGLDVRVSLGDDDLQRSQRSAEIGSARELAEVWRLAVLAKGGFEDVTAKQVNTDATSSTPEN